MTGHRSTRHAAGPPRRGFTLVVGLIMLLLLTLSAISALRLGSEQTIVVANAQHQNEAVAAAQEAIDAAINSSNFTNNPAAAIPVSNCPSGAANTLCIDTDSDGVADYTVTLAPQPTCVTASPILTSSLKITSAGSADEACLSPAPGSTGVIGSGQNGISACANSIWEVSANAVDAATGTTVNVVQGVGTRIASATMAQSCP